MTRFVIKSGIVETTKPGDMYQTFAPTGDVHATAFGARVPLWLARLLFPLIWARQRRLAGQTKEIL